VVAPAAGERFERSFVPGAGTVSKTELALGMIGCAVLGAGVYAVVLAPAGSVTGWPLLLGGLVLAGLAFFASPAATPVRVGELGIIVGDPAEASRLYWHELRAVRVRAGQLRLESGQGTVALSLAVHAQAAARIVAEAGQRIGERLDVSPKAHERLPQLSEAEGERVPAARLRLAGQKCLASGVSITFESDAGVCSNCAALYHVGHVPASCLGCARPLAPVETRAAG